MTDPAPTRAPVELATPSVASPSVASPSVASPSVASPSGDALVAWTASVLPYRRCITGDGLRETLRAIGREVPIAITEVPSGTPVLDWTVPPEWRVRDAWIALPDGTRVVDVAASPLHLVQYSAPVRERVTLSALRPHLHTVPERPDWIPYRTDYYTDGWGFCLRQSTLDALATQIGEAGRLEVGIDAELFAGSLTYGEVVIPGETDDEILISAHACHPALANDNAASLAVATALARQLEAAGPLHHTVRFVFAPGTIGGIAWLARNRDRVGRIRHGLVLANLGDRGGFTYKQTRWGLTGDPAPVDTVVPRVLEGAGYGVDVRPFDPFGYDERQYGSPGFALPVGRLTRTPHAEYPEYHTSADDLSLISPDALAESLDALHRIVLALDCQRDAVQTPGVQTPGDQTPGSDRQLGGYRSRRPYGEPQLGRRGLYRFPDGTPHPSDLQAAIGWVLCLGDGRHTLADAARISRLPPGLVRRASDRLVDAELIEPAPDA